MESLKAKLTEKSTITTLLTLVAGIVGYKVAPDQVETISAAVIVILSLVGIVTPEKK